MGLIVRQSIFNALISYSGAAVGFLLTIFIYPRVLDADQYGLTRLLISVSMIFIQFSSLGTRQSIIKYYPHIKQADGYDKGFLFFFSSLNIIGFLIIAFAVLLFKDSIIQFYAEGSELFVEYYNYLIPLSFFILFFELLNSYSRALYDTVYPSFLNEILLRILLICVLILYAFQYFGFEQFLIAFVTCYAIQFALLIIHLIKRNNFNLLPNFQLFNSKLVRQIGTFSMYSFLGGITTIIIGKIDIIMLSAMRDLESTAIYSIAFYVGSVIAIPSRAINKISFPVIANAFKINNLDEVDVVYKKSSINQLLIGVLIYIGVWANLENLFTILPPDYRGGELVVLVIGAAFLFDMATGINGAILVSSRFYKFNLYFNMFLVVVAIIANYLLIPKLGILGASTATALSIFLYNSLKFIFVWKKLGLQPFTFQTILTFAIGGGVFVISLLIPKLNGLYVDIMMRSLTIAILFMILSYFLNISDDLNKITDEIFKKVKKKISNR